MGKNIQIRVDKRLQEVLEDIRKKVAGDIKKEYGLEQVTVYGTLASQILVAQMNGNKVINFKIRKVGMNKGVLELIY